MGNPYKLKHLLTFVLLIFLLIGLSGDSAGRTPSMDIRLGYSHASFWGEDARNFAGNSVTGVGDVNGDGLDDVLIGASGNDEGGSDAGQVYLIFGRVTGLARDTNLSKADASFWGESPEDHAGDTIAGAGDVNGDGYDDILISATSNDEGGTDAGQTYLILGHAFGWAMDTNLSSADASFWGEASGDRAGYSVSSAGDVNDDGFDDILIGADQNDEGGDRAGQAYLIFGKATGWTMDTNLSSADASFWGEAADNWCGVSVAGAGDVNGDGFDDILVGAIMNDDGGDNAGQVYLVMGKTTGWSTDVNLSKANASFLGEEADDRCGMVVKVGDVNGDGFDDILISEPTNDDGGSSTGQTYLVLGKAMGWAMDTDLSTANASFWGESTSDRSGASISGVGDIDGDGYDDFLIGAPGNDESDDNAGQTYLFLGQPSGWAMDTDLSKANASFLGEGIYDGSGDSVSGAGDVNGDGLGDILIGAHYNVEGGYLAGQAYLVLSDASPPRVERDSTSTNATTGDEFTFNISASDDRGILDISIEYWYGDRQASLNQSSNRLSGDQFNGKWFLRITTPEDKTETLHYIVHIKDIWRVVSTIEKAVLIRDNDPPSINDMTPSQATTGDEFSLKMQSMDNINLTEVRVEFWLGDDGARTNDSMTDDSFDVWTYTIDIPEDSLETLHYIFYAKDNVTNIATTVPRNVTIVDNDMPILGLDTTKDSATTGEPFIFSIETWDNLDIDEAFVTYRYGGNPPTDLGLTRGDGDLWEATIAVDHTLEDLKYLVTVRDTSGNENATAVRTVDVIDNDLPVVLEDLSDTTATTGDPFMVRVVVEDNLGVANVSVVHWFTGEEPDTMDLQALDVSGTGNGTYGSTIAIPNDSNASLQYHLELTDAAGNTFRTEEREVEVRDDEPPGFGDDLSDEEAVRNNVFHFAIEFWDNIGVEELRYERWFGEGEHHNGSIPLDTIIATDIPLDPEGPLRYLFSARDAEGNWNHTEVFERQLPDRPPTLDAPDVWTVVEEEDEELYLGNRYEDPDSPWDRIVLGCSYPNVTVMGMTLVLRHDVWVPEYVIELSLTDGENTVWSNVTVHVVPANDLPVITQLMYNSRWFNFGVDIATFERGGDDVLVVRATDEEGDDLTFRWFREDQEVATGERVRPDDLPLGSYILVLVVDDGTDSVRTEIPVLVIEEEETSYIWVWVLLLLIVVAVVLALYWFNRSKKMEA